MSPYGSQAGGGSLSLNASKTEMHSDYQSVDKQTGINAGKASNTTHTAVSEGEIVICDKVNQKQDVTDLSRYTDNAHEKLNMIFDKEKEQKRIPI
ncbi:hypothetical protein AB6H26_08540 [Providencia hangzhouensis]|uniref:Uncharacterized protein n=1 Tax=Providencia rettgeri TaxID=587 RepID=A0AAW6UFC0_PRORE|nr:MULTISPECIES: hypothetical protein [Providencia]MBN7842509.1 hypothetical protein [Providencia rettgeri]MBN7864625.1 hypothetical protein [Providencia rettgeri]MBN7899116.1 hypothetical protein [Providencia rettgeri]MBO2875813.1 hypothetical protein [Providencia rettgeri]MBP1345173.1 hypothetical protein [Providencia rettgeri]